LFITRIFSRLPGRAFASSKRWNESRDDCRAGKMPLAFFAAKMNIFLLRNTYVMPKDRSLDIDTPLDFMWAEFLSRQMKQQTS